MTELIVALDLDDHIEAAELVLKLVDAGVTWFKVGQRGLLADRRIDLMGHVVVRANLFLDLKVYDTRDTVANVARRAWELGARMLTVHATPSMLEAAMATKPAGDRCMVLAVDHLTDNSATVEKLPFIEALGQSDGIICPVSVARWFRHPTYGFHGSERNKLLVCPGVRPVDNTGDYVQKDNHAAVASPLEAKEAAADFIVVGRLIYNATDPAGAARTIIKELG